MKRCLILSASFGEGHNSAARAVRAALDATGDAVTELSDLYAMSLPRANRAIQIGYSIAINRYPALWGDIFALLDKPGWLESTLWTGSPLQQTLERLIDSFKPDKIVSTYPLYAYLYRRIQRKRLGLKIPFVTIVTDSVGVNSAWYRCRSDAFLVADQETADLLSSRGVPTETVHPLGFPVSPAFAIQEAPLADPPPWKLLFMPSTQVSSTLEKVRGILALPNLELTVITGRNHRVKDALTSGGLVDGVRCKVIGWTDSMPELLASHHAFIGKAGGAIVQEAMAAKCPFIVCHLVPGQEEGNIHLIERLQIGVPAHGSTAEMLESLRQMMAENGAKWKTWKASLSVCSRSDASARIARFLLDQPLT
jgi:processive 1,2-diacylglycerol beta-glucosyltransferase